MYIITNRQSCARLVSEDMSMETVLFFIAGAEDIVFGSLVASAFRSQVSVKITLEYGGGFSHFESSGGLLMVNDEREGSEVGCTDTTDEYDGGRSMFR